MQRAGESRLDPARVVGVQLPLSAGHVGFAVADGHDSDDASTEGELDRVRQLGDGQEQNHEGVLHGVEGRGDAQGLVRVIVRLARDDCATEVGAGGEGEEAAAGELGVCARAGFGDGRGGFDLDPHERVGAGVDVIVEPDGGVGGESRGESGDGNAKVGDPGDVLPAVALDASVKVDAAIGLLVWTLARREVEEVPSSAVLGVEDFACHPGVQVLLDFPCRVL